MRSDALKYQKAKLSQYTVRNGVMYHLCLLYLPLRSYTRINEIKYSDLILHADFDSVICLVLKYSFI